MQARTKLQKKFIKEVPNYCKLQVTFKSLNKTLLWFSLQRPCCSYIKCGLCNESYYGECVRHLTVRNSEHIHMSSLTNKRVQPRKHSVMYHHLLRCSHSSSFEDFSMLCHKNKNYLLELKENNFIMRDSFTWDIHSMPLYLLEWVLSKLFVALCGDLINF